MSPIPIPRLGDKIPNGSQERKGRVVRPRDQGQAVAYFSQRELP